ncbi:alpha-D-ribose 1-methylphosphonate 5-triphosphate diphosphatase [Actibacterium ureilyticum]|uniref:alpha-D-ribose 1-methylphosphonate 5-triphosphate diphosphatase n=1 Tax=Actibacterium ureilyticum TaxID=1590614 RepID=UPI000BAADB47|nr:alpha-D-ribose 1-methylphosphonate 5-triphosphate diphosphatase [Actibacterium ureilyticum]
MDLPELELTGARVLRPDGWDDGPVAMGGGRISGGGGRQVDLSGCLILPGIVDLHGDAFERHLAPRRGAMTDLGAGFAALDAELAAQGITTAVLAQFYSYEGGMRRPDFAERMVDALAVARPGLLTDMRLQLRFETHMLDDYDRVQALIDRAGIGYVVYNDHLPHDALAAGKKPPRLTGQALKSRRSPEAHLALMQDMHARRDQVPAALAALSERLLAKGVLLGSHDDATPEVRAGFREMGVRIAEFPETRDAAQAAKDAGDPVILGAPNVMRGASHAGNVSAIELILDGIGDALVSDYHYPAPLRAAFALGDRGLPLEHAWPLVSAGPAAILGLDDRGQLAPGKRADLIVVDSANRRVGATFVAGRLAFAAGRIGHQLMQG